MSAIRTVPVDLGDRSYAIRIGAGLIADAGKHVAPLLKQKRVIIVTDANVGKHYLAPLTESLKAAGINADAITLPAGEQTKSFTMLEQLTDQLLALRPERGTTLIALGGGVIGDITGFAASILMRGMPFIQIPTTLLAQVDSSVGGKTGINTKKGKNLIGSFYQPKLVLADTGALSTLPRRELLAGYAEVVKYGLIDQPDFFNWLEKNGAKMLAGDAMLLAEAVEISCKAKAGIVARDEKEADVRALLNLGHTFGHALEAETGYSDALLHGEAVAIGMVLAFGLSARMGLCTQADAARMRAHIQSVGLKTEPRDVRKDFDLEKLIAHMHLDKKVQDGKLTFVLARGIGKAFISQEVDIEQLRGALAQAV